MRPAVRLPLRFDPAPLKAEVGSLGPEQWVPHFNTDYYEGDWSGVALRSVAGAPLQLYPDPAAEGAFTDTQVLGRCPALRAVLATFACEQQSARLLRLAPGSAIREHRDFHLGFEDGELRVHIPIVSNAEVEFLLESRRIPMGEGEAWYLDLNRMHSVANRGREARVHLVLDCVVNDWLEARLAEGDTPE